MDRTDNGSFVVDGSVYNYSVSNKQPYSSSNASTYPTSDNKSMTSAFLTPAGYLASSNDSAPPSYSSHPEYNLGYQPPLGSNVIIQPVIVSPPRPVFNPSDVENAAKKLSALTLVGTILGFLLFVAGIVTLVIAGNNPGFPVFNFGPLLTGLIVFIGYGLSYWNIRKAFAHQFTSETLFNYKCPVITMYTISTICITFAILSGVFAILSGVTCSGGNIQFYTEVNGDRRRIDAYQFCFPNDKANAAMAFVDAGLSFVLAVFTIFGMVYFCVYGRYFGARRRYLNYGFE